MWAQIKELYSHTDPVAYAVPFFLLMIAIELYINYKERKGLYIKKDAIASVSMGLGSLVVQLFAKTSAFLVYSLLYQYRLIQLDWIWYIWVLIFFADDITFYFHHRFSHQIRVLWAAHETHHSSQKYNLSTALRQSWTELIYKYVWWLWLPLVGFPPLMILMMMSVSLIYQFWIHTEIIRKFPAIIEFIFNTPSHHRVHHASNIRYLDRNHGGILIIWDRLFGTFEKEDPAHPVVYGITTNIQSYNVFVIAFSAYGKLWEDLKKSKKWKDRFGYIFKPPGWSHDGSSKTADQMREEIGIKP